MCSELHSHKEEEVEGQAVLQTFYGTPLSPPTRLLVPPQRKDARLELTICNCYVTVLLSCMPRSRDTLVPETGDGFVTEVLDCLFKRKNVGFVIGVVRVRENSQLECFVFRFLHLFVSRRSLTIWGGWSAASILSISFFCGSEMTMKKKDTTGLVVLPPFFAFVTDPSFCSPIYDSLEAAVSHRTPLGHLARIPVRRKSH